MRAKTILPLVFGALLAVALLIWFRADRTAREAEASAAALAKKRVTLEAEVRDAEERVAAAEQARNNLERALAGLSVVKPSASPAKNTPFSVPTSQRELISRDSKLEALELNRQRAAVAQEYGYFFHALGLSSAQIEQFTANAMKRTELGMDLFAVGQAQDAAGKQTVVMMQQQAKTEYEAAQAALLGAEDYRRLQEYERTVPFRNVVVFGLAGAAALEGIPLSAQQGEQLFQAAVDAAGRDTKESGLQPVGAIDWDALDARARQILSPAQFALFQTVAPPSGFRSRWYYQLETVIGHAKQTDATAATTSAPKPPGGR
jgi:hypothetical protein